MISVLLFVMTILIALSAWVLSQRRGVPKGIAFALAVLVGMLFYIGSVYVLSVMTILTAPSAWVLSQRRGVPNVIAFALAVLAGILFYIGSVYALDWELERAMYRFDLDGDRVFSGPELTDEANAAIDRWSSDTGRSFAPVVAPIVVLIWTSIVFFSIWVIQSLLHLIKMKSKGA